MADSPPPLSDFFPAALLLDFDGTLVELAESPDAIKVPAGLAPLLGDLAVALSGRLAIVSGRSVEDLQTHLDCHGLALSGSHGAELLYPDGRRLAVSTPPGLGAARRGVIEFAKDDPRLLVEDKPTGVALHYRAAPDRGAAAERFMAELAEAAGLALQRGKMVVELRPPGSGKGEAVRRLMGEPPFAGARPVFVGDDLTDEEAFEAAAELGGGGVLVGEPRPTAARWRLADVTAVARWLEAAPRG